MSRLLVFDLDGTLVDTLPDIAASVNRALRLHGLAGNTPGQVRRGIGNGAAELVRACLHNAGVTRPSPGMREAVLRDFLDHYAAHCLERSRPYPGVPSALAALASARKAVLTNKPILQTRRILDGLGLASRFDMVVGGDGAFGRKPDPGGLRHLLESAATEPADAVFIGDGPQDHETARAMGVRFIAFTGGYGSEALDLKTAAAAFDDFAGLPAIIAGMDDGYRVGPENV